MTVHPLDAKMAVAIAELLQDGNWLDVTALVQGPSSAFLVTRSADGVAIEFNVTRREI